MLTQEREKEIRDYIGCAFNRTSTNVYLTELLAEIDYLRDSFLDMNVVRKSVEEKLAVAVEALEEISYPTSSKVSKALVKLRGEK